MNDMNDHSLGLEMYQQVFGEPNQEDLIGLRELTINHLFAHIWSRAHLSLPSRRVIVVALLAAQGKSEQLKKHIRGALKGDLAKEEILEIMIQVAHYAGWAAGTSGQEIALDVLREIDIEADPEKQSLKQLNEEIGEREKAADRIFFHGLLAEDFVFRRAGGEIEHKAEYLHSLEKVAENPYERLDTQVQDVTIDNDSAVTMAFVMAKRKVMKQLGRFKNVRMFRREDGEWKLVAWINTREG